MSMIQSVASSDPTSSDPTSGSGSSGSTGSTGSTGDTSGSDTVSSSELNQLSNPQLFLQLLVAELQNQDPTNPMDPSTILSQTSELSQMEAVNTMTTAISSEQGATQATQADGLIGMQISATVGGNPITGTVTAVLLSSSGEPTLNVGGTAVPLSAVTEVTPVGTDPTTGTTGGSTTTS
jgi:flagellar basal-body rod modification protein FlgD